MAACEERDERPDVAEVLPVERFRSFLELIPERGRVVLASEEELRDGARRPLAGRHHQPALRGRAPPLPAARTRSRRRSGQRTRRQPVAVSGDQPHAFRAQAADTAARTIQEAEPELEKLVRSGYLTVVAWARRGEAERAAYNLARLRPGASTSRTACRCGEHRRRRCLVRVARRCARASSRRS